MEELQRHTIQTSESQTPKRQARAYKVSPSARRPKQATDEPILSTTPKDALSTTTLTDPPVPAPVPHASSVVSTAVPDPVFNRAAPAAHADNKPEPKRRLRHEEKYDRVTLYLEKHVHKTVQQRYNSGEVENLSAFFNAAVKEYLAKHFDIKTKL